MIRPIPKSGSTNSVADTRPIAILPELSKLFERLLHSQLIEHLEANDFLDSRQGGFRRHHSTQTTLISVLDDIRLAINRRLITILVLFDFSKAFDMIPHDILLTKLRAFGCSSPVLKFFYSYLADRLPAVFDDDGTVSDFLATFTGVPQGSVLGPLLFLIFINDLPSTLRFSNHALFADDLPIYVCPLADLVDGVSEMV